MGYDWKKFLTRDRIGGSIWLALGIYLCHEATTLNIGGLHKPGPGFTPLLAGACLIIFGLVLIFFFDSEEPGERGESNGQGGEKNRKTLLISFIIFVGYILVFERIGFSLSTFFFFFLLFKLTDPKRWVMPSVISASAVILSYLVFSVWLKTPLP